MSTSVPPLTGVALVGYHNNFGDILLAFYTDPNNGYLSYAYQTDASQNSFQGSTAADTGASPETFFTVDQNATYGESTSGVATAVFNGNLYVGYVEAFTHQFVVLQAHIIPTSSNQFSFSEVYRDPTAGALTTAAGATVQNGSLVFVYGTTRNPSVKNEAWTTWLDAQGLWHSEDAGMNTPSQPGLALFNGILYMVQKQNNSNNGIFINVLDNTGHYSYGYQINGGNVYWRTPFGFSMTVWNNELIFAADG